MPSRKATDDRLVLGSKVQKLTPWQETMDTYMPEVTPDTRVASPVAEVEMEKENNLIAQAMRDAGPLIVYDTPNSGYFTAAEDIDVVDSVMETAEEDSKPTAVKKPLAIGAPKRRKESLVEKKLLLKEYQTQILIAFGKDSLKYKLAKKLKSAPSYYKGGPIEKGRGAAHKLQFSPVNMPYKRSYNKGKTYKKKKTTARGTTTRVGAPNLRISRTRPSLRNTSLRNNVRGILYPHANTKPRHMDGATAQSQTFYNKSIFEINIPPNELCGLMIVPFATTTTIHSVDMSPGDVTPRFIDLKEMSINTEEMTDGAGRMRKEGTVEKWRLVSRGAKLTLLNTHEKNDGWFESFRVTNNCAVDQLIVGNQSNTENEAYVSPSASYLAEIFQAKDESQSRGSYVADSLKKLQNYYFKLNPYAEEHPFINLHDYYRITTTSAYVGGPPKRWFPGSNDTQSYRPILDNFCDTTYDSIAIFIHGGASGSKILVDLANNCEVVYANESTLARFHTPPIRHAGAQKATNHAAHNTAAGVPIGTATS